MRLLFVDGSIPVPLYSDTGQITGNPHVMETLTLPRQRGVRPALAQGRGLMATNCISQSRAKLPARYAPQRYSRNVRVIAMTYRTVSYGSKPPKDKRKELK